MHRWLPLCLIFVLLIAFRALGSIFPAEVPNFQPLSALFFCGAVLAVGWRGFMIPVIAWLLTYPLPAMIDGKTDHLAPHVWVVTLMGFGLAFLIGNSMKSKSAATLLAGSLLAAASFHLITNGAAWIGSPMYPKTAAGLWQSLWTGPEFNDFPIHLPSWVFLRNMMAANFLFTSVVLLARSTSPAPIFARLRSETR